MLLDSEVAQRLFFSWNIFQEIVDAATGIILKPVEGAKNEGFGGFFKGTGITLLKKSVI